MDDGLNEEHIEIASKHVLSSKDWVVLSPNKYSVFLYQKRNSILWELHIQILPEGRRLGVSSLIMSCDWMFENTGCKKIIGITASESAVKFTEKAGFKIEGKITKAWQSNQELSDMTIIGFKKGDVWLGYRQQ